MVLRWSDRRSLDAPSYVAKTPGSNTSGIPWEACVKLANSVEKDMWINIPGHADDDYILNLVSKKSGNIFRVGIVL